MGANGERERRGNDNIPRGRFTFFIISCIFDAIFHICKTRQCNTIALKINVQPVNNNFFEYLSAATTFWRVPLHAQHRSRHALRASNNTSTARNSSSKVNVLRVESCDYTDLEIVHTLRQQLGQIPVKRRLAFPFVYRDTSNSPPVEDSKHVVRTYDSKSNSSNTDP